MAIAITCPKCGKPRLLGRPCGHCGGRTPAEAFSGVTRADLDKHGISCWGVLTEGEFAEIEAWRERISQSTRAASAVGA